MKFLYCMINFYFIINFIFFNGTLTKDIYIVETIDTVPSENVIYSFVIETEHDKYWF